MKPIRRPEQPRLAPTEVEPVREDGEPSDVFAHPATAERGMAKASTPQALVALPTPTTALPPKSDALREIESILSEHLREVFLAMPPAEQQVFKRQGEQVAQQIDTWMQQAKLVARKVLKLIRGWLSSIPRVNVYFLEQESKRKTDRIMQLNNRDL